MMMALANPSMAESSPKPISATEPGDDAGDDGDRTLQRHVAEADPRQQPHPCGEAAPLVGGEADRRGEGQPGAHAPTSLGATAASSATPASVSAYMTILRSRRAVTRPAPRSARA